MTKLELLKARRQSYLDAEQAILNSQEYQLADRKLRRPDLSEVRAAISALDDEIALLESSRGRTKRVVLIE